MLITGSERVENRIPLEDFLVELGGLRKIQIAPFGLDRLEKEGINPGTSFGFIGWPDRNFAQDELRPLILFLFEGMWARDANLGAVEMGQFFGLRRLKLNSKRRLVRRLPRSDSIGKLAYSCFP